MDTNHRKELALKIARLTVTSRLQDLLLFAQDGDLQRSAGILAVLERLDPGAYLVGAGPYTQGIHLLRADETVLGRLATPLEQPKGEAVDIFVNDAPAFLPREVSRIHAVIIRDRHGTEEEFAILDRGSTCGTYVNGEKLQSSPASSLEDLGRVSRRLNHADVISLGPSHVNVFLFLNLMS
jgi:FHA domain